MNTLELNLLLIWIVGIMLVQFHQPTMSYISKYDYLGFFPCFFLFSPKPFYGFYKIRYEIRASQAEIIHGNVEYISPRDLIDTNQKVIKCINDLCKSSLSKPHVNNIHFRLLVNFIMNEARQKSNVGKLRFYIVIATNRHDFTHFKSQFYDL